MAASTKTFTHAGAHVTTVADGTAATAPPPADLPILPRHVGAPEPPRIVTAVSEDLPALRPIDLLDRVPRDA